MHIAPEVLPSHPTGAHRQHLGEHNAGSEDVGPGIHRAASSLFRRHVGRRAGDSAGRWFGQLLGDAEVQHDDPPRAGDDQILRFQVPMNEYRLMDRFEPGQELRRDLASL